MYLRAKVLELLSSLFSSGRPLKKLKSVSVVVFFCGSIVVAFSGCDMGTYEARFQEKLQNRGSVFADDENTGATSDDGGN